MVYSLLAKQQQKPFISNELARTHSRTHAQWKESIHQPNLSYTGTHLDFVRIYWSALALFFHILSAWDATYLQADCFTISISLSIMAIIYYYNLVRRFPLGLFVSTNSRHCAQCSLLLFALSKCFHFGRNFAEFRTIMAQQTKYCWPWINGKHCVLSFRNNNHMRFFFQFNCCLPSIWSSTHIRCTSDGITHLEMWFLLISCEWHRKCLANSFEYGKTSPK